MTFGKIASFALAAALVTIAALPAPAAAQIQYGSWRATSDCRPARVPSGVGRNVRLPQAPGGTQAMECTWERDVTDCPRIRDNLRHPIRCATRKQRSGYSLYAPRD